MTINIHFIFIYRAKDSRNSKNSCTIAAQISPQRKHWVSGQKDMALKPLVDRKKRQTYLR